MKSESHVTIQMKAIELCFPALLFIIYYTSSCSRSMVVTFEPLDKILKCDIFKPVKTPEQYFTEVLFIVLYKVVPAFASVSEIFNRDQMNRAAFPVIHLVHLFFCFFLTTH